MFRLNMYAYIILEGGESGVVKKLVTSLKNQLGVLRIWYYQKPI